MQVKWTLYPTTGIILDSTISRLPWTPVETTGNSVVFYSPVWDVDTQTYVPEYFQEFVGHRTAFQEAFNCDFDAHLEFVGGCDFVIDPLHVRALAACNVHWHVHQC